MAYQYRKIPEGIDVIWIKLIKPYVGNHLYKFPKSFNVGDITWIDEKSNSSWSYHFENNYYMGNFTKEYFEIVEGPNNQEQYEIY